MKIVRTAVAGTLESSDVLVTVRENPGKGIEIQLRSIVERQFGKQIIKVTEEMLGKLGIDEALVQLNDRGALDCTIEARVAAASYRACGMTSFDWEAL